jgi:hypothetical protein
MRNSYKILIREHEGKTPFGKPKRRWDNIKIYLREMGLEGVDWIHLAQDRFSCEHGNEPYVSIKSGKFLHWLTVLLASRGGLCCTELVEDCRFK